MATGKMYFEWYGGNGAYRISDNAVCDGYDGLSLCALSLWLAVDGFCYKGGEMTIYNIYNIDRIDSIYLGQNKSTVEQWIKTFTDRLSGKIQEPLYYQNNFHQVREYQGYVWINTVNYEMWNANEYPEVALLLTIEQLVSALYKYGEFLDNEHTNKYTNKAIPPEPIEVEFFYHYGNLKDLECFWPDNYFTMAEPFPPLEEMKRLCETERQKYLAECKKLSTQGGFSDKIYFFWYEDHFTPASREFLLPQKATDKNFRCSNGIYELACWLEDEITVKTPADNLCRWTERINQLITDAAPSATMRICETGRHHFIAEHQGYIYLSCVYIEEFRVMITLPQMANLLAQYQAFLQQPAKDPARPPAPLTAEIFAEGDQAAKIFHTWQA